MDESIGIKAFSIERNRQIEEEGYTPVRDSDRESELARAATCYMDLAADQLEGDDAWPPPVHPFWPWSKEDWKPSKNPRRNMEKASALAAAAYDEIVRQES